MTEASASTLTGRGLVQQGYLGYSTEELAKLTWGLRFTPSVCMAGALLGLATQTAWIHFVLAVLGGMALVLPAHHPFDLLYNHGVRRLVGGPMLPPNPLPRRVACFLGGGMNLGIGLSFQAGLLLPAYFIGGALVILQLIVITSQFCVASWMMEGFWALLGRGILKVSSEEAHRLIAEGSVLVDVRSPQEFAAGHLAGALNVPVDEVKQRTEELRQIDHPLVIYCSAGVRCHKAAEILRRAGIEVVHELGSMSRW